VRIKASHFMLEKSIWHSTMAGCNPAEDSILQASYLQFRGCDLVCLQIHMEACREAWSCV
jgi:hypothetical protein